MRWLGQHIWDFVSRFRSDVYLDDISTGTIASGGNLGLDSNNKIVKAAEASGDLTAIVAGTNLGGTDLSGPIPTINLDNPLTGPISLAQSATGGGICFDIDNNDVDQIALQVAAANTTANAVLIDAPDLTSANALKVDVGVGCRQGVLFNQDMANTTAFSGTAGLVQSRIGKTGVIGDGLLHQQSAFKADVSDTATNHVNSSILLYGYTSNITSNSVSGSNTNMGFHGVVSGATLNYGVDLKCENDRGADIIMRSSVDDGDTCTIATTTNGATTITTTDDDGTTAHFEIAADGNITLDSAGDIALECGGGGLTCDASQVTFSNGTADKPLVEIKNTNSDTSGAELHFIKDKGAAGADGDELGVIKFYGDDAGQNQTYYSHIKAAVVTAADGTEGGSLKLAVATHDGEIRNGLQIIEGNAEDEVDVTIGDTATSVTTVAGTLTMGSTATLDNSGNLLTNAATATNLVASTSTAVQLGSIELGHADDTTIARSASGVATIESNIIQTRNKVIHIEHSNFSDDIDTTEHFIPFVTTAEHTSFANVVTPMIMPVAGKLLKVHYKANNHTNTSSNEVTFRLYDLDDGELWTDGNKTVIGTKVVDGVNRVNMCTADFQDLTTTGASGTNAFTAGEMIGVSIQNSQDLSTTTKYSVTMVFELDFNSY